ncbi:MAG: Integrins alpha chain protein, partial [Phycisphaerales bacterium]|nr:Integrins alpha chain protein [Phycisphaerales bacterium]
MRLCTRRLGVIAHFLFVSLGAFFLTAPAAGLAASITPVIGAVDGNTAAWQVRYAASGGAADAAFVYGVPSWTPLLGDWAGGGNEGIGEFDPNSATWYLRDTASAGGPTIAPFAFGGPHWKPVSGRW